MPKTDDHPPARSGKSLDERLGAVEAARIHAQGGGAAQRAAARGYRFVGEVVGGVLGGFGFGWLVDRFAGTSPLGLICGLLIGSGLSIFAAVRSASKATKTETDRLDPLSSVPEKDED